MSDLGIVAAQPPLFHLVSFQDLLVRLGASHAARRSRRWLATMDGRYLADIGASRSTAVWKTTARSQSGSTRCVDPYFTA